MTENMKLWDAVCKTDPGHTKKVSQRGGFTAIDAHYQVMMATKQFGPVGKGWGYTCEHGISDNLELAWCDVSIWWLDGKPDVKNIMQFGPIRGMCKCKTGDRIDQDASKKAMTDALTKGLSHLGFSADVFLGLFDDNKYVQDRTREVAKDNREELDSAWAVTIAARMSEADSIKQLGEMWAKLQPHLEGRTQKSITFIEKSYADITARLTKEKE